MFEFKKLCDAYEELSSIERGLLLTEKAALIMTRLNGLSIHGMDAVTVLAGFVIGSVAADGKINEKEYLIIYPSLVHAFGEDFDFATVKKSFSKDNEGRKMITEYTEDLIHILDMLDDELKDLIITLCLCILSVDGHVSLREKNYIRKLCKA